MNSTIQKSVQLLLAVAVTGFVPGTSEAQVQSTTDTGIQNNGIECIPEAAFNQSFIWRSGGGLQNAGVSAITVFCPLTEPSYDSYSFNLLLRQLELHYNGSAPTNCKVLYRGSTGSLTYSPTMVGATSTTSGTPVIKLSASFRIGSGSVGVQCSLPSASIIVGSIGKKEVAVVTGGI
jgi:hypothetical protein